MRPGAVLRLTHPFLEKGNWVVSHEGLRMGDMRRKFLRVQQLSEFALTDSLREEVSNSLRKRRKSIDVEEDNGTRKEELRREGTTGNSSSPTVVVNLRSSRAKRSAKVGTRSVVEAGFDCEENAVQKEEPKSASSTVNSGNGAVVMKVRSTRAKRSDKVGTRSVVEAGFDCEENAVQKEEPKSASSTVNSGNGAVVMKVRSTRAKRSDKVGTGSQVVKAGRLTELHSTIVEAEVVQKSGLGDKQEDYKILDGSFYECDALELAPKLLGKLLRRDDVILQITEVEAYRPGDTACHARAGETARTAPLFGPAGHAYVYLCYGIHMMLNVVADSVGVGAAVLIRACSPVAGLSTIQLRRGQVTAKPALLTGPGKVGQALGLTTEWTSHSLCTAGGLEILDAPPPSSILVGPRVGIDYAEPKDVAALWRFAIADSPWVSAPRATLRPQ